MKRTSSMIYNPTSESHELFMVATNSGNLYERMIIPVLENLGKKILKGVYDADRAIEAFYHIADQAARQYKKDFGYMFTVTERWSAAQDMRDYYAEDYMV